MKKLLILGAGVYQVPLIKKAKEMGLYTIVASIPGNYPGFELADKIYYENTTDYGKILEIAKQEKIDGICTTGTDVAVVTIGKVCDELNLCGLSFEAARIASNKTLMKQQYEKFGVRTARFRKCSFDMAEIRKCAGELRFPLIFKAVDTSGSRGIVRVDSENYFENAVETVKAATKLDSFIIEEFLEGAEFGAQAFIQGGVLKMVLPHGDYVFRGNTGVPIGHYAPYNVPDEIIEDAKVQLVNAAKAMQLDNCALNADFILYDGKVYVLEIGGRAGATGLSELVSIYYGYDYYEKIIRVALGEDVDFSSEQAVPNASMLLMSEKDGVIKAIENNNEPCENIYEIVFDYKEGDSVRKFKVGPDRIGHVIARGNTLEEAKNALDKALGRIKVFLEE